MKPCHSIHPICRIILIFLFFCISGLASAQVKSLPDTSKMGYNEISSKLKLYAFPAKNQTHDQQKKDEFECYKWAMDQSGVDPLQPVSVQAAPVETGPDGTAAKGAAKGALVGLAVGSVSGNAGEGAAIGAGVGAAKGARQKGYVDARKQQESNAKAQSQEQEIKNSFIKAFSACLEGKGYTIK